MKHRNYSLTTEKNANLMRKHGFIKTSKKKKGIDYIRMGIKNTYNMVTDFHNTLEAVIFAEEWYWLNTDRQCYFFDDIDVANNVAKGSYRVDDITPVFKRNEAFMLMLPKGFKIGGHSKGGGLLVNIFNHMDRKDDIFKPFYNDVLGQEEPNVTATGDMGNWTISVAYQEKAKGNEYMRCSVPNFNLNKIVSLNNALEYKEYMIETNKFDYFEGMDLEGAEYQYQYEMLRLVAGFLVYRHALPERVRDGFPQGGKRDSETASIRNTRGSVLRAPQGLDIAHQAHYRSWHFRQLMDERFYKGEHKDKPAGSRIIFVKDSMVNREVKASTIE